MGYFCQEFPPSRLFLRRFYDNDWMVQSRGTSWVMSPLVDYFSGHNTGWMVQDRATSTHS